MSLTREIIKQIFQNIGAVPDSNFGTAGLVVDWLKIEKTLQGKFEDGEPFICPIWAGKLKVDDKSIIRCVFADLTDKQNSNREFLAVIQASSVGPRFGIRLLFGDVDEGLFLVWDNQKWKPVSIFHKARILSGMELIVSYGLVWEPLDEVDDLVECLDALSVA